MSLTLRKLDDRTWDQLVTESRALIPTLYRSWTDHNPADPGITLMELLAWLTEMLLYRLDRLPDAYYRNFLRLLRGGGWDPGSELAEDLRATVLDLRRRHRAVTAEDYEILAREATQGVARSHCVSRRDLAGSDEGARSRNMPGHVSVVVVPAPEATDPASALGAPLPPDELLEKVWTYLDARRLLTARHHVVGPIYAPISVRLEVAPRSGVPFESDVEQVTAVVTRYLDPLLGGNAGTGWPFGRAVYLSDLYRLLEGIPWLEHVEIRGLTSTCPPGAPPWCVEAAELWLEGEVPIALELADHHLPWLMDVTVEAASG